MADFNFILLYVDNPAASGSFYADLLGKAPVEASPTFVMFRARHGCHARPLVLSHGGACGDLGGAEASLAVTVDDVDAVHADWRGRGLPIIQEPTPMDSWSHFRGTGPGWSSPPRFPACGTVKPSRKVEGFRAPAFAITLWGAQSINQ